VTGLAPGQRALLVHGLGAPDPVEVVEVLADGRCWVRYASGSTILVARSLVTAVAPSPPAMTRLHDVDTSIAAAAAVRLTLRDTQLAVLGALVAAGDRGMTDHEHEQVEPLHLEQDTAGKRRGELMAFDPPLVEDSGQRRQTPRKRWAKVWRVTAAGRLVWQLEQRQGAA
jgi:hypothetical protein